MAPGTVAALTPLFGTDFSPSLPVKNSGVQPAGERPAAFSA